jgi:hypothetical protein
MQIKAELEMSDTEQEILVLIQKVHDAKMWANRVGEGEWRHLAYGGDAQSAYTILQELERSLVADLFSITFNIDQCKVLDELVGESGEPYLWILNNHLTKVLEG